MYTTFINYNAPAADNQVIKDGLDHFNNAMIGVAGKSLSVFLKDENGKIHGGVGAWMYPGESIYIQAIWVEENLREKHYGTQLMQLVEEEAIKQGCRYSTVDTYSFQAEEFYLKIGYERMGEIKNLWFEHSRIFLRKHLFKVC